MLATVSPSPVLSTLTFGYALAYRTVPTTDTRSVLRPEPLEVESRVVPERPCQPVLGDPPARTLDQHGRAVGRRVAASEPSAECRVLVRHLGKAADFLEGPPVDEAVEPRQDRPLEPREDVVDRHLHELRSAGTGDSTVGTGGREPVGLDEAEQFGEVVRPHPRVRINEGQPLAGRSLGPEITRRSDALAALGNDRRVVFAGDFSGRVARVAVDDEHLVRVGRIQRGQTREGSPEVLRLVSCRHHETDICVAVTLVASHRYSSDYGDGFSSYRTCAA